LAELKPVRFSVSLDNTLNFRLQYLSKFLGTQRASLAADFIECAVFDAKKHWDYSRLILILLMVKNY
jgi:hypothetical protein